MWVLASGRVDYGGCAVVWAVRLKAQPASRGEAYEEVLVASLVQSTTLTEICISAVHERTWRMKCLFSPYFSHICLHAAY